MSPRRVGTALAMPVLAVGLALLPAAASAAPTTLTASATGANEVGSGATGATASGTFTADPASGQFCYTTTSSLTNAVAMHIHRGAAGTNGPVVIPLDASKLGAGRTCTSAAAALLSEIVANPAGFYFNVHTPQFPAGAVRGQLVAAASSTSSTPTAVGAGSGGQAADSRGTPVLPAALLLAGLATVGLATRRLVAARR